MKILQINSVCKKGSTGKIAWDIHCQLKADGHESWICYGRGPRLDDKGCYKFSTLLDVYGHGLLTRLTGLVGYFSNGPTNRLLSFMDSVKPDLVHLHNLHGYYVNMFRVLDYLKKRGIRTVMTLHDELMYTGKCAHSNECEKWMKLCEHCPQVADYPASLVFDFSRKMFRDKKAVFSGFERLTIVTPSEWLARRAGRAFGRNDIEVIRNGIDTEGVFHPRDCAGLKARHGIGNEKIVLAVAPDFMNKHKGGRYVIELSKRLKSENIRFILIGVKDSGEKYDDNIIALARTEDQNELAAYYSMADAFVICSDMETFPTVCLEALSCGTPIVGFDTGGTRETAPHGLGIFVPYGDMDALQRAIMETLSGDDITDSCAVFGRNNYSKAVMFRRYLGIYLKDEKYFATEGTANARK